MTSEGRALPLEESAGLVGAYCWMEQRLFSLTGSWVAEVEDAAVRVHLDRLSSDHGWHAELWDRQLPVSGPLDPASLIRPRGLLEPFVAAVEEAVSRHGGGTQAAARADAADTAGGAGVVHLALLQRSVLPRLTVTYRRHLERTAPATDAHLSRVLRSVLSDQRQTWAAGENLLQERFSSADIVRAATRAVEEVDLALADRAPGAGLVPWPGGPEAP